MNEVVISAACSIAISGMLRVSLEQAGFRRVATEAILALTTPLQVAGWVLGSDGGPDVVSRALITYCLALVITGPLVSVILQLVNLGAGSAAPDPHSPGIHPPPKEARAAAG